MSDLKAAAQQALEALVVAWQQNPHWQITEAMNALRAVLAQQEQMQEPVEIKPPNPEGATQCIVRWLAETPAGWIGAWDREALERLERFTAHPPRREPEQEPVARVLQTVGQYHTGRFVAEVETVRRLRDGENLYTAPPRREWVSLTDEEIVKIVVECHRGSPSEFYLARDIEQALKEKNQ